MKSNIKIYENALEASIEVAQHITSIIQKNESVGKPTVLGLATGNTPLLVYKELVRLYHEKQVSFQKVITFNLDEYYPMAPHHPQSYVAFMKKHLFDHIDIDWKNVHIPNGELITDDIPLFCKAYEDKIVAAGGLDFQLLGIGRTGHIGFNEPESSLESLTRLVDLNPITREDAIADFNGLNNVPKQAISMGVQTIYKAKEIMLLAFSEKKSDIIQKAIQEDINPQVPASYLQKHPNITYILDNESASKLKKQLS